MNHLKCLLSKPDTIIITDDAQAERDGLRRTWPNAGMYLCIFRFLQSMWRWLLLSSNKLKYNIDNT